MKNEIQNINKRIELIKDLRLNWILENDTSRYENQPTCGNCSYLIRGNAWRCEDCDYNREWEKPLFCENCPCLCYYCQDCEQNIFDVDENSEIYDDCREEHEQKREIIARRLDDRIFEGLEGEKF